MRAPQKHTLSLGACLFVASVGMALYAVGGLGPNATHTAASDGLSIRDGTQTGLDQPPDIVPSEDFLTAPCPSPEPEEALLGVEAGLDQQQPLPDPFFVEVTVPGEGAGENYPIFIPSRKPPLNNQCRQLETDYSPRTGGTFAWQTDETSGCTPPGDPWPVFWSTDPQCGVKRATVTYTHPNYPGEQCQSSTTDMKVFDAEIDADGVSDDEEETPGAFLALGKRKRLQIQVLPQQNPSGLFPDWAMRNDGERPWEAMLRSGAAGVVTFWDAAEGGNQLSLADLTWAPEWDAQKGQWVDPDPGIRSQVWVQGQDAGSTLVTFSLYLNDFWWGAGASAQDTVRMTVAQAAVDLLVNGTEAQTDDYVVKDPPDDPDVARQGAQNAPAGPADNWIPLTVRLHSSAGPTKVYLTDTGGGDISIRKADGTPYEGNEEELADGGALNLRIYGLSASQALNDVHIEARTGLMGQALCGHEALTAIWIEPENMFFRGSDHQGEPLTPGSTAKFSSLVEGYADIVGTCIYAGPLGDAASWQMEFKYVVSPLMVFPSVSWDLKREVRGARWGPGRGELEPVYTGAEGWVDDDVPDDEDAVQDPERPELFQIDGPGGYPLPRVAGFRFSKKASFREWAEVQIGGKWYVCSPYGRWFCKIAVDYVPEAGRWMKHGAYVNEVVSGNIEGDPTGWAERDPKE